MSTIGRELFNLIDHLSFGWLILLALALPFVILIGGGLLFYRKGPTKE